MQLSDDEFRILMAYRHKDDLAAAQETLNRAIVLMQGKTTLEAEEVRRVYQSAKALDDLMVTCGFLGDLAHDVDDVEEETETAADDRETEETTAAAPNSSYDSSGEVLAER